MIIQNGYIRCKESGKSYYDEDKCVWVKPVESWSSPIPCQWRAIKCNLNGVSNGEALTIARFEILVNINAKISERVQLFEKNEQLKGEFSAISIERLHLVSITKILV